MDTDEFSQELEVIKSIFSLPGECKIDNSGLITTVVLVLKPQADSFPHSHVPEITLTLQVDVLKYPHEIPQISVSSGLIQRQQLSKLRQEVATKAQILLGQTMFADLISVVQDFLNSENVNLASSSPEHLFLNHEPADHVTTDQKYHVTNPWLILIQLDHMRAKQRYIKTIANWTIELDLKGKLIFFGKLILLLMQGSHDDIKNYVVKHRSCKVDVDSRGKSCKEKMMTVLCEQQCDQHYLMFETFCVLDCETKEEVQQLFLDSNMIDLYDNYIKTLAVFHCK